MQSSLHEQTFNVQLAKTLRLTNARWRNNEEFIKPERQGPNYRIDVDIDDPGLPRVVIECEYEDICTDKDAIKRLDQFPSLNTAISLAIPTDFRNMSEDEVTTALMNLKEIKYALFHREDEQQNTPYTRFPIDGYLRGSVVNLGTLIQTASTPRSLIIRITNEVAELVLRCARILEHELDQHVLDLITEGLKPHTGLSSLRVISILWLDAMMVQSHLVRNGVKVGKVRIEPLPSHKNLDVHQIIATWRLILEKNWHSIFEKAVDALETSASHNYHTTKNAISHIINAVRIVESGQLNDQILIGSELFPLMLKDRKEVAAYYTTPATAELLSSLLVRKRDDHDWKDPKIFQKIQIADLSCGTGTLLRAAFLRIKRLLESNGCTEDDLSRAHRAAMEVAIKGTDISPIAAHLCNSNMALLGKGEAYGDTNIGWVSVGNLDGNEDGLYRTGSLEFLRSEEIEDLFYTSNSSHDGTTTGAVDSSSKPITVRHNYIDYVLMNPPYTQTNGKHGAFDIDGIEDEDRHKIQKRWFRLLKGKRNKTNPEEPFAALKTAGMAASFLCLASLKLKIGGRLGFVLPLTAAFADSWKITREMIVNEFHDILIIARAGFEKKEAMSEDTGMGEMLLVGTKRSLSNTNSTINCITLKRMPTQIGEAGEFASAIQSALDTGSDGYGIMVGEEEIGRVIHYVASGDEPWSHLGTLNLDLARSSISLRDGHLRNLNGTLVGKHIPMTVLGDLFDIGPTNDLIGRKYGSNDMRGAFTLFTLENSSEYIGEIRSLWKADSKEQKTIQTNPTHRGVVRDATIASRIAEKKGMLHYAQGMRWTSQALLVAKTTQPVFGGRAWLTLLSTDLRLIATFALWSNSTFGFLLHWIWGSRTQNGRSAVATKSTTSIPCPDFRKLSNAKLETAQEYFHILKDEPLLPAYLAYTDKARKDIDSAIIEILDLPDRPAHEAIEHIRNAWCAEPTVHGGEGLSRRRS